MQLRKEGEVRLSEVHPQVLANRLQEASSESQELTADLEE